MAFLLLHNYTDFIFVFVIKLKNKSKVLLINTSKDVYCPSNII